MKEIKNKLVALEAKVDATLFAVMKGPDGRYYNEDGSEGAQGGLKLRGSGIPTAAGLAVGGYAADRAIMNNYGGGGSGMQTRMAAYRSAGRDAMESGRFMGNRAINAGNDGIRAGQRSFRATKPGAIANKSGSMGLFGRLRKALGTGARIATGGKVRFEDQVKARIVELAEGRYQGGTAALLGNPITAAMNAKKGKKLDAFGEAYGHQLVEGVKGAGLGAGFGLAAGAGAGIGAGVSGALSMQNDRLGFPRRMSRTLKSGAARRAVLKSMGRYALPATLIGGSVGGIYGGIKGNFGKKAREIRNKYVQ